MKRFVVMLAVLVSVVGCGSGDPAPAAQTTGASAAPAAQTENAGVELEAAVRAYSAAYLGGRGDAAYDLLSRRCKERMTRVNFVQMVEAAGTTYGALEIQSFKVDQVAGDLGRVTYTYAKPELDQRGQPWTREAGAWHFDGC